MPSAEELQARLDALTKRVSLGLERVHAWIEPLVHARASTSSDADLDALREQLSKAEDSARLQAQRCTALEDRIVELEAALVGAREHRDRAEAQAEAAREQANAALDELEQLRSGHPRSDVLPDAHLGEALQAKLLEIERLTRERDGLRRTCDELRTRNRELRRERDESTLGLERSSSELDELRTRDANNRGRLAELERIVGEQRRELELAERRAKHLREHLRS